MKTNKLASDRVEKKLYGPELREGWGAGPWQDEPDEIRWTDPATGYRCVIGRSPELGSLLGYVGVPSSHPAYGTTGDELYAHGGLNWHAGRLPWETPEQSERFWWFGFDCAHVGRDLVPSIEFMHQPGGILEAFANAAGHFGERYRDVTFVEIEIASLIAQLACPFHL